MRPVPLLRTPKCSNKFHCSAYIWSAQKHTQKKNLECRSTLLPMRPLKTPSWRKQYTPNGTPGNSHCSGSKMKLPYATEKTAEIMGVRRNSHWKEFWKLRMGTELCEKLFAAISLICVLCVEPRPGARRLQMTHHCSLAPLDTRCTSRQLLLAIVHDSARS